MTDDRSLERVARSWIEVGPTRAPDRAVDAALARIQTTTQERDSFPWRLPQMLTPVRVAMAAVLGVLLLGGALLIIDPLAQPAVGPPGPATSSSLTPTTSPSTPALVPMPVPEIIWGDWQAQAADAIPGVAFAGEAIQLSVNWDGGDRIWIQRSGGFGVLTSPSLESPDGEIHLFASETLGGCEFRDEGRYEWERHGDGQFLTFTLIEDACAARAAALARTWVHSLTAVNDGGPGVIPIGGSRWLQATLPSIRWALGSVGAIALHTFDESDPTIDFIVIEDPRGFDAPCAGSGQTAAPIDGAAAELVEYVQGLPGLTVATEDVEVDDRSAVHLEVTSDPAIDCPSGEILAFDSSSTGDDFAWALTPGDPHSFWVVEVDGTTQLIWYEGDGVAASDERAVIDSLRFLDALPTP